MRHTFWNNSESRLSDIITEEIRSQLLSLFWHLKYLFKIMTEFMSHMKFIRKVYIFSRMYESKTMQDAGSRISLPVLPAPMSLVTRPRPRCLVYSIYTGSFFWKSLIQHSVCIQSINVKLKWRNDLGLTFKFWALSSRLGDMFLEVILKLQLKPTLIIPGSYFLFLGPSDSLKYSLNYPRKSYLMSTLMSTLKS